MKKFLLLPICCLACASMLWAQDDVDEPVTFKVAGIRYQVNQSPQASVTVVNVEANAALAIPARVEDEASVAYDVTAIAGEAFYGSKSAEASIPASVTSIADNAFFSCNLSSISVADDNEAYKAVDGVLYDKNMTTLCCFPPSKSADNYQLPESVSRIGGYAFCGVWLTAFDIPERVTAIGRGAFMGTKIKKMDIPASVTEIGGAAFQNCQSLTSITFPEGMTLMPDHILATSWMLSSVNLPGSLTEIGDYAFNLTFSYGMVKEITIPDNVTSIGMGAFQGDRGLTSLTLGRKVDTINWYAFAQCAGLRKLVSLNTEVPECVSFSDNDDEVLYAFNEVPDDCVLYVPEESVELYEAAWGVKFKDIRPLDNGGVGEVVSADDAMNISVSGGVLNVSASESVEVFNVAGVKVASASGHTLSIALPSGLYVVKSGARTAKVTL